MGLTLKAGATYTGPRFINALNQGKIPGVSLFAGRVGYQTMLAGHKATLPGGDLEPGRQVVLEFGDQQLVRRWHGTRAALQRKNRLQDCLPVAPPARPAAAGRAHPIDSSAHLEGTHHVATICTPACAALPPR